MDFMDNPLQALKGTDMNVMKEVRQETVNYLTLVIYKKVSELAETLHYHSIRKHTLQFDNIHKHNSN